MRHGDWRVIIVPLLVLFSTPVVAAQPQFVRFDRFFYEGDLERLPSSLVNVSGDGRYAIGADVFRIDLETLSPAPGHPGYLTGEYLIAPHVDGTSSAQAVSTDGRFLAGRTNVFGAQGAMVWEVGVEDEVLGPLKEGTFAVEHQAISDSGDIAFGVKSTDGGPLAYRWQREEGTEFLTVPADLGGEAAFSRILDATPDGELAIGLIRTFDDAVPFSVVNDAAIWTDDEGWRLLKHLSSLPEAYQPTSAALVSRDGKMIAGRGTFDVVNGPNQAFVWTEGEGLIVLVDPLDPLASTGVRDIARDAKVVLGSANGDGIDGRFLWDEFRGVRSFIDVLTHDFNVDWTSFPGVSGLPLEDDFAIRGEAISDDGLVFVGNDWAINLRGQQVPGDADFDDDVDLEDFSILKENFGVGVFGDQGVFRDQGDFNADGRVDLADFSILKGNFGKSVNAPEPSAFVMTALAAAGVLCRWRLFARPVRRNGC